ncbi:MAG: TspO/MBR family protein [FCB group bacterium]|jgi:tryptophan-rich sensory protein|nr:TspO/MBR family protein [FCB group bacterium]
MKREYFQWFALAGFLVLCFGAAAVGSMLTAASVREWYPELAKPSWNPPNSVFAPVWTALYLAMALSAWLVWRRRDERRGVWFALGVFVVQLALNVAWSGLFFGLRSPGLGLIDIVFLWLAILATLVAFWRINTVAGVLLLPYLIWVSYAAALNLAIWRMNP